MTEIPSNILAAVPSNTLVAVVSELIVLEGDFRVPGRRPLGCENLVLEGLDFPVTFSPRIGVESRLASPLRVNHEWALALLLGEAGSAAGPWLERLRLGVQDESRNSPGAVVILGIPRE